MTSHHSNSISADIQPYFECVSQAGRMSSLYTAYLSWNNRASSRVAILKDSPQNKFTGLEFIPGNQPDLFLSGASRKIGNNT